MKDSHKDVLLDELRRRLSGYEEAPDVEVWNRVYAGVHPSRAGLWVPWAMRIGAVAALFFLSLSLLLQVRDDGASNRMTGSQSETTGLPSSDTSRTVLLLPSLTDSSSVMPTPDPSHVSFAKTSASSPDDFHSPGDTVQWQAGATQNHESQEALTVNASDSLQNLIPDDLKTDSAVVAHSRDAPVRPRPRKSMVLYAGFSGSLAFQKITPFSNDGVGIQSFHTRHVFSQERFGMSLHAGIQSRIARRLELYSGLTLYSQSLSLVYEYRSDDMVVDQDNTLEYSIGPGTKRNAVEYNMLNAGVEAGFIYYLTGDRLLHKFGSGLLWHHGFKSTSGDNTYDNARSHYLHYQLFYRNELIVNNKTNIFLQPFYRHTLLSRESLSGPFKVTSYFAGLTFGIVYRPD